MQQPTTPKPQTAAQAGNMIVALRMQRHPIEAALHELKAVAQNINDRAEKLQLMLRLNDAEIGAFTVLQEELAAAEVMAAKQAEKDRQALESADKEMTEAQEENV